MTFEEISEKAFKNEKLANTANLAEKYTYWRMFNLYRDYRELKIKKDAAEKEKQEIVKEFNDYQERIKKYYDVFKEYHENRLKFEKYIREIEKSQTQEDILDNSLKLIELIIQDRSFFSRTQEKLENNN